MINSILESLNIESVRTENLKKIFLIISEEIIKYTEAAVYIRKELEIRLTEDEIKKYYKDINSKMNFDTINRIIEKRGIKND